jgi:SAM-dependent methyltransferase
VIRYYAWALAEKGLEALPHGERVYSAVGRLVKYRSHGTRPSYTSSLRLMHRARDYLGPGSVAMDIGSGWFHHDAFMLYLVGEDITVYLFDVREKARLRYVRNYLRTLLDDSPLLSSELGIDQRRIVDKLRPLLDLRSLDSIYERCGFIPCVTAEVEQPWLEEQSVDFMVSNCVLNHIPPAILEAELESLKRMLKPDGAMYHLLGHDDHWAFHDRRANMFNYYRYSDGYYRRMFETFEYQNRMVRGEWLELFERLGLEVVEYYGHVTDESRRAIRELPIDERYTRWPRSDLAIIHSYVLLSPARPDRPRRAEPGVQVREPLSDPLLGQPGGP